MKWLLTGVLLTCCLSPLHAQQIETLLISSTWNVALFRVQAQTPINSVPISTTNDVQFGPDGRTVYASTSSVPGIQKFDLYNDNYLGFVGPYAYNLASFVFGPDNYLYAVDLTSSRIIKFPDVQGAAATQFIAPFVVPNPSAIAFGPDGHLYVASQTAASIKMFNGSTGALIGTVYSPPIGQPGPSITDMEFGPDGFLYCTSFYSGTVIRINPATGAITKTYGGPGPNYLFSPKGVAFTSAGELLVSTSSLIKRIDPVSGDILGNFASYYSPQYTPAGRLAVGVVPEPSTLLVVGTGLAGMVSRLSRKRL